jgi:hypothetical protein
MKPNEFDWEESQRVTVTNPTKKDYVFKVHSKDYKVEAGETYGLPGFIAWVYVYGLATQMAQADGKWAHWNEEGFRKQYYDKIVVGTDAVIEKVPVAPKIEKVDPPATATITASRNSRN